MQDTYTRLTRAGAQALTLGILTLVFGITTGVLNIVNGGKLLHQRKALCCCLPARGGRHGPTSGPLKTIEKAGG